MRIVQRLHEELLHLELAALREEDFDLDLLGFDDDELVALLADEDAAQGLTDEDDNLAGVEAA